MTTRAKFVCNSVTKRKFWQKEPEFIYDAEFSAVGGNSEENKIFFAASPSGSIKLSQFNSDMFVPGKEYYIDFISTE